MTFKHNPKDIAITAQEFIHCLLAPKVTLTLWRKRKPDFSWFDEPESHINAGHFRLEEELKELGESEEISFEPSLENLTWEESEFWDGQFIKELLSKDGIGISYAAKERLVAHAFTHQTVSDLKWY